jgi:hypothetical protein
MLWYKQFLSHMKKWYRHQIHIFKSTDKVSILASNTVRFDFRYIHQIIPWKSIMWATHLITFAICLTLITYFESSAPGFIILVHLATCRIVGRQIRNHNPGTLCVMTTAGGIHKAISWMTPILTGQPIKVQLGKGVLNNFTCKGCSSCIICLSETRSHWLGTAKPVSDSLIPDHLHTKCSRQIKSLYPTTFKSVNPTRFFSVCWWKKIQKLETQ